MGLLSVLPGDVVLPPPSWVSYAAQAALAGKRTWSVPIATDGAGGVPDPSALEETLAEAARQGAHVGVLVLTLPDNPTRTVPSAGEVRRTVEIADAYGLNLISDEIYRDLAHEPGEVLNEPPEVVEHIARSRHLHRATATAAHERLVTAGISCRPPSGGFYLYPDFQPVRSQLAEQDVDGGDALATHRAARTRPAGARPRPPASTPPVAPA